MRDWVRCPKCGHKMFKLVEGDATVEIKCSSCKSIVRIYMEGSGYAAYEVGGTPREVVDNDNT